VCEFVGFFVVVPDSKLAHLLQFLLLIVSMFIVLPGTPHVGSHGIAISVKQSDGSAVNKMSVNVAPIRKRITDMLSTFFP